MTHPEPRWSLKVHEKREDAITLFGTVYDALHFDRRRRRTHDEYLNLVRSRKWIICVFPKEASSACYFAEGEENILFSPASVDMGGVFITPLEKDFIKITAENMKEIMKEVSLSNEEFHEIKTINKKNVYERAQSTSRHSVRNTDRVYSERSIRD